MFFVCHPKILHKLCSQFLLGVKMAPRENENKAYAKFGGDKQRTLWYAMVFSGVVNTQERLKTEITQTFEEPKKSIMGDVKMANET